MGPKRAVQTVEQRLAAAEARNTELEAENGILRRELRRELKGSAPWLDQVHDSIISTDLEGNIVGWSRGAEKLFGYEECEAIGQSLAILYFEADRPQVGSKVLQPLLRQGHLEIDLRNRRKSGEQCFIVLSMSLLRDDKNQPYGMLGVATDITPQRAAEREQRASQERLQLAIDAMQAVVYEWDLQKGEARIIGDLKGLIGVAAKDGAITRKSWTSRLHPDDLARTNHQMELALAGQEQTVNLAYRIRHKDGRWIHMQDHALILRDSNGAAIRVVGGGVDVSGSVELTCELQFREQLLNSIGDPVIALDGNYCIRYCNVAGERMYGVKCAEIVGKHLSTIYDYRWLNPEDEERAYSKLKENGAWCGENVHILKDGREIPVSSTVTVLPAEAGGGMIAVIRDISDEKRAVLEREQRAAELERANQDLTHFAFAVAHDLKTPLRNVTSFAQLLALTYQGSQDDETKSYIRFIVEGARRLGTMLDDLMRIAEAAGRPIEAQETVSLDEALGAAVENLRHAIRESGATIVYEPLPSVFGSLGGLTQLFQNLLGNSLKYRKPDLAPEIKISASRNAEDFVISVRDNGIGFEAEAADKIFGVFQRLHTNEFEGTGIGLTLCKRIVERAGGRIWATGNPGEGANFSFTLPAESRQGKPEVASSKPAAALPLADAPSDGHFDELFQMLDLSQAMVRKLDGTILIWTQRAEQMFGWTKAEAVGRIASELLKTEFPEPLTDIHAQLLKNGFWSGEVTRYGRGTAFTLATHWSLYRDGSGRAHSVIEVFTDITALKQAELELERSSRQRDLALSAGKMGVWRLDCRTGVVDWDTTFESLLGMAPGSFEGTYDAFLSRVHPADWPEVEKRTSIALESGPSYSFEYRMLHVDGSYRWLGGEGEVTFDDDGPAVILGVVWDVTSNRQSLDQMRALGEKLKLGIQVSGLAIVEIDFATNTGSLSAEAAHLFGLGDAEITVPREVLDATFHPDDRQKLACQFLACLDPANAGWFEMDHRVVRPDGQVRWLSVRHQVFFTGAGEERRPLNAILAAIDITDRKQAELDGLFEVNLSAKITLCEDSPSLLQLVVSELAAYSNTSGCTFAEIDLDRRLSETVAQSGADSSVPAGPLPLDAWGPIVNHLEANQPAVVNDTTTDPRTRKQAGSYGEIQAFLAVPLRIEGRWVASISVFSLRPRSWTEREVELLRSVSERAWLGLENLRLRQVNKDRLAQFENTFNQAAVGIAHVGLDGRWLRVNRRLCEIVGYSPQEVIASDFQQITHPDDLQLDLDHFAALHRGETASYSIEKRYIHKNGSTVWINLTVSMSQAEAASRYAISVVEDITARKEIENQNSKLSRLIEWSKDFISLADLNGKITYLNAGARRMIGAGEEQDLSALHFTDYVPQDWQEFFVAKVIATARESGSWEGEMQLQHLETGARIDVHRYTSLIRHPQTHEPIAFATVARDITEQKRVETALRRSEANLRDFIENASIGLHWVGPDGMILWANQTELDLLGYTREEYVGHHIADFHADADVIRNILPRLTGGETIHQCSARLRCKDGSVREVSISSNALFDYGKLIHTRCFTVDVTDWKRAERELRDSEATFRAMFHISNVAKVEIDAQTGGFLRVNAAMCALTNYTEEELLARTAADIAHPEDRESNLKDLGRLIGGEISTFDVEKRYLRKGGEIGWARVVSNLIPGAQGRPARLTAVVQDITTHKAAAASLRDSEQRYRSLVEQVVDGILVADRNGQFLDANGAACQMLGYEHNELRLLPLGDVLSPEEHQRLPGQLKVLASGEIVRNDWRFARKDGSTFIGELVARSLFDGRLQGIVRDVTERKQKELQLQEALARLSAFSECAPVGIAFFDEELRYRMVNESLAQMNGLPVEAHLGQSVEEIVPDLASQVRAIHRHIQETGKPTIDHDFSGETRKAPGVVRHWTETWFPVATPDSRHLGIGAVILDVTDRKRAEEALRESELRFRALVETVPAILYSLTPAGELDFVSPKFTEITGLANQVAKDHAALLYIHGDDRPAYLERLTKALASGQPFECEYRLFGRDGRYRWFMTRALPVRDETGRVVKWFGAAYDVDQQKLNEAALQALNGELNRFAFAAAHDLREPLRNIRGFTDLLVEHSSSPQPLLDERQLQKARSVVTNSVERMDQLLADLLEYSVIGEGNGTAQEFESSSALQKAIEHLSDTIARTGSEIVVGESPVIHARESEIVSLFQNLIENAIKYRGPHAPRISISATRRNGEWLFSVADNGRGIENQYAKHIFGIFKRLAGHEVPGTGIGLAIVEKIVTRYGGTIWVESEVGQGSVFRFTWPLTGQLDSKLLGEVCEN